MLRKLVTLVLLGLCAAGCATNFSARLDDAAPSSTAGSKGVVLVHTSLHDERCHRIGAHLAQADGSGRYIRKQEVTLKGTFDLDKVPSQIELPAGEYGFVGLNCTFPYNNRAYHARPIPNQGLTTALAYQRPIATFRVEAGEVVDIGSLRLPARMVRSSSFFGGRRAEFVGVVTPIPEPWLQSLAATKPNLFRARIVRPMTVPPPESSAELSPNR